MGARTRLTLGDLAASLGVSKTTVSNAFSRPDQLSADLRARILEAAYAAGYAGPDPVARMLRTGRAGSLGLILPESLPFSLDDTATTALLRGIADACEERRLGLLLVPGGRDAQDTRTIADVAVDGFVAYSLPHGSAVLDAAIRRGVPVVIVDQPRLPGVTTVSVDDRGGAREAARHIAGLGHRRVAIVSLPMLPDGYTGRGSAARLAGARFDVAAARQAGYLEALAEVGIAPADVPVFECAHSDEDLGADAGRHLLAGPDRPTAILAMSDRLALGVLAAARGARIDVPRDLSVVGFNDTEAAARARPALTTIRQPLRLKGYAAARLILDAPTVEGREAEAAAAGGDRMAADELDLPVELVIRRSTAVAAPGHASRGAAQA
jgi:DNA-binding LacI/PurR family transcriptional regulator